jgi:hypothetical protein
VTCNLGMEFFGEEESFGFELGVEFFVGEDEAAVWAQVWDGAGMGGLKNLTIDCDAQFGREAGEGHLGIDVLALVRMVGSAVDKTGRD